MKKIIFFIFVISTVGIFLTGCGKGGNESVPGNITTPATTLTDSFSDKMAKEAGKQLAENMLGGVKIDFSEEGSGDVVPWPEEIPSDVPVFKYAVIDASIAPPAEAETSRSVAIQFREVEPGAYAKYEQDLKDAGWEITTDASWTDRHISATKGDSEVEVDVNPVGEKTAFLYWFE